MVKGLNKVFANLKRGSELFTKIKILKIRNDRPTVIEFLGQRYVWDSTTNRRNESRKVKEATDKE